jgi:predicted AlkP superfamily phosphohydrolase/phosphomutase
MNMMDRVAIIGLDSVPPEIMFDKLLNRLPNIRKMFRRGIHGSLRTCHPPITIPAWMVMMTGKNPGKLGIYGFRHRKGYSYNEGYIVNSSHLSEKTVWDVLSENGKKSILLGVPPSYPPKHIKNCEIVSCFLTPGLEKDFTYPSSLRDEIIRVTQGKYKFDVTFRVEDREKLKEELFEMTEKRFDVAESLASRDWDFFMMHEIGFDRLHHAFWKFFDPSHPKHVGGNPYEHIDAEYYSLVDKRIGRLLEIFGEDCLTLVVSDHGSKRMVGAFCINQWLEREGYLVLKNRPEGAKDLEAVDVDWERTKAWAWGGYYARIFFNVKGREPNGIISPEDLNREKLKLKAKIMSIVDNMGKPMRNLVFEPEEVYGVARGDKPDLMVYLDDLNWRSAGTVGHGSMYLSENDTGPDDSVHSMYGIFLMYSPRHDFQACELGNLKIESIGPTILNFYGLDFGDQQLDGSTIDELAEAFSK